MFGHLRVVCSPPSAYANPAELSESWQDGAVMAVPAPVATISDAQDLDAFDWWHHCSIELAESTIIEFQGLSFPASVFVDGDAVAECESMFLPLRIEVGPGRHDVCVVFRSLDAWLRIRRPRGRWRSSLAAAAGLRWARTTLLGRAPVYGNLPAPVGFWRPVVATAARLSVRLSVTADPVTGAVGIAGWTASSTQSNIEAKVFAPSGETVATGSCTAIDGSFRLMVTVGDPQLWWPHGYGPQSLYRVMIRADDQDVGVRTFGFRSVEAVTDDGGFGLRINGASIFCRGVAWSPPDPVRLTVDRRTMRANLAAFADTGANMVRVVGGLVYEQAEFWELCAELGLMVWQDAMQATFDPPAEVSELIVREMTELFGAISGNPALTVVSGGSETLQRPEMLGIDLGDFDMPGIDVLLPQTVAEYSGVPYVRASPSPPADAGDLAIRPDTGVAHWFGVGGYLRPLADVRNAGVRFAAECLAFANPPSDAAVERHFGSAAVAGHHPGWKAEVPRDRGSSWDFEDVRDFYVREVFAEDPFAVRRVDPQRYLELGRLAITEAMVQCFAFWRQPDSRCAGALVLTSKDVRPGAGWGLMDVDGEPKAALQALARVWAPVSVVLTNAGLSGVRIDLYNDTPDALSGELTLIGTNALGHKTVEAARPVSLPGRSSVSFVDSDLSGSFRDLSNSFKFGQPTADGIEATLRVAGSPHARRDALIVNPRPCQVNSGIRASLSHGGGTDWLLEVVSDVALRYVCIEAPGWTPSDNYFHLISATPYTVRLQGDSGRAAPVGKVTSVDSLAIAQIKALS